MNNRGGAASTKKAKLKPKLRFPEFEDEWDEIKLVDVTNKKVKWSFIGGPFGSNLKSSDYTSHGIRIIQLQNIGDAEFLNDYKIFTTEQKANELLSCNIYPGDIILSKMGDPVGRACLIPDHHVRYLMCSDGIRLVVNEKIFSKYFVFSAINSNLFRNLVERTATGSTRKRIGLDDLRNLPMVVPRRKEQQKIADCLSSIDDRITAETQKLNTLKAHKKGLMQQLFPAEGETLPKLRFPKFQDVRDWEVEEFSKYIVLYRGSSPRPIKNYLSSDSSAVNWIKIGDTKSAKNFIISQVDEKITPEGAKRSRKVNVGELILANSMSYGKTYQVAIDGCIYDGWFVLRDYEKYFDQQFLLQFLNSEYMQKQYERFSAGGIVQNISSDIVYKTVLPHASLKEQRKIADCLSSLDELITAQTQKIATIKTHKKGLMQQLFPSLDEVKR